MPVLKQRLLKIAVFSFAVMIVAASPASFANGWVAVGERGTILNSQDGINWVEVDSPTEENAARPRVRRAGFLGRFRSGWHRHSERRMRRTGRSNRAVTLTLCGEPDTRMVNG